MLLVSQRQSYVSCVLGDMYACAEDGEVNLNLLKTEVVHHVFDTLGLLFKFTHLVS